MLSRQEQRLLVQKCLWVDYLWFTLSLVSFLIEEPGEVWMIRKSGKEREPIWWVPLPFLFTWDSHFQRVSGIFSPSISHEIRRNSVVPTLIVHPNHLCREGFSKSWFPGWSPCPVTPESLEGEGQTSILFSAPWVITVCSQHREPQMQLEWPAYSEAILDRRDWVLVGFSEDLRHLYGYWELPSRLKL